MRILQIINSLHSGGAEVFAVDLACEMQRQGAEAYIMPMIREADSRQKMLDQCTRAGVTVVDLGKPLHKQSFGTILRYRKLLRHVKPDVVHSHCPVPTWACGVLTPLVWKRAKRVCTLHSISETFMRAFPANLIKPWNHFHRVICVSQSAYDQTEDVPNKSVIPVSRDLRPFLTPPVERSLLRDQFKISPEQLAIIHVGRMEDDPKNQEALIRAFAQTDPKHNALLLFAGDGPKRKGFEELANQLAPGRVRFLGLVSEMAELYHAADGLVLPSLWEGRPLVVMEAVAAGLPCLFSPIAPLKEVAQGLEGVLYTEGTDVESIRSGLEQALSSWGPSRWRRDKDNCSLIIQSWGIEQCAKLHWGPEGYDLKP